MRVWWSMVDLSSLTALDILRSNSNDVSYVFEALLNNVGSGTWEDEDWVAGDFAIAEVGSSFADDSARLLFSNKYVKHAPSGMHRAISSDLFYVSRINRPFNAAPYPNFGGVSLAVLAGSPIKNIYHRRWEAGQFRVLVGGILNKGLVDEVELAFDDYKLLLQGQTKTSSRDETSIKPTLAPEKTLDVTFPPTSFKGTGGAEGDATHKGKPKPFMLGKPLNVTPVALGDGVFMYFDASAIRGADENGIVPTYLFEEPVVRDNGTALTADGSVLPTSTNAQIVNATVASGEFVYNDSLIKVGGDFGEITIDASGLWDLVSSNYGITNLIGGGTEFTDFNVECRGYLLDSCKRIIEELTDIEVSFDDNVPVKSEFINNYVGDQDLHGELSGWYQTERTTLRRFITQLLSSAGYLMLEQLDGTLLIKKRESLNASRVVGSISRNHIVAGSEKSAGHMEFFSEYVINYQRNWTIQSQKDLPGAVSLKYSSDGAAVTATNSASAEYGVFDKTKEIVSPFIQQADSQSLADTVLKDGQYRRPVSFSAVNEQWQYQAGDLIKAELRTMPNQLLYELLSVKEVIGTNLTNFEAIAYG